MVALRAALRWSLMKALCGKNEIPNRKVTFKDLDLSPILFQA